jgi:hypothetical protein
MLNSKKKLQLVTAFSTLLLFAIGIGCGGFFVDPTLSSMTITPSAPSVQTVGQTVQLTATGVYNDGSTKNLTASSGTTWTTSASNIVSVNSTGLIKAVSISTTTVTITATNTSKSGAVSATATVTVGTSTGTVTVTCTQCSGNTISISGNGGTGSAVSFTADQNGTDVTSQATWTSSNSSIISIGSGGSGTLGGSTGNVTITATVSGTNGNVTITVTQ